MGKSTDKKRATEAQEPGCAILPEDRLRGIDQPSKRSRPLGYGPVSTETGDFSIKEVETRIIRGMKTLRSLPDHERRFLVVKSGHPSHIQEHIDAYGAVEAIAPKFRPTPADVSQYLQSLSWVRHLPRYQWQLIWWRSFDLSFGTIGKNIGQSDETARRHYRDVLIDVWSAANGLKAA